MANTKITELTAVTTLAGTDVFPVVDVSASTTNKVSVEDLLRNAPDGTAGAPSIANADDQDTGILFPADNSVGVSTGGTQRLVIDSSGDVGVGSTAPNKNSWNKAITLEGSSNCAYELSDNGTLAAAFALQGDDRIELMNFRSGPLTFKTNNTERIRINSGGKVGIGTSSIDERLHVEGSGTNERVKIENTTSGIAGLVMLNTSRRYDVQVNGSDLQVYDNTGSAERLRIDSSGNVGIGTTSPVAALDVNGRIASVAGSSGTPSFHCRTDTNTGINLPESDRIQFITAGTERVRIDSSGNVGIGTTSPNQALKVVKSSSGGTVIEFSDNVNATGRLGTPSNQVVAFGGNTNHSIAFGGYSNDGSTFSAERMRIDSSGNVGIGSTNPAAFGKFVVQGTGNLINLNATSGAAKQGFYENGTGRFYLSTLNGSNGLAFIAADGSTERMRVDSSGRLLVGTSSALSGGNSQYAKIQTLGNTAGATGNARVVIGRGEAATAMSSGYSIGEVNFTDNTSAEFAQIQAFVDGTPGSNDYPGRLVFNTTADGAASPTERMRIDSSGNVGIGTTSPSYKLHVVNDSSAAARIGGTNYYLELGEYASNSSPAISYNGSGASLPIRNGTSEVARFDSSGRLLVGTSSSLNQYGSESQLQVAGTGFNTSTIALRREQNGPHGPGVVFAKSRSSSLGGSTAVQNGDAVGSLLFAAADGSDLTSLAAQIKVEIDGTPGSNDTPGRIMFMTTADGASSPTERMRITSDGTLFLNGQTSNPTGASTSLYTNSAGNFSEGITIKSPFASGNRFMIGFYDNGNSKVGDIVYNGTSTAYNTTSDYRLKENVVAVTDGITRIKQLNPRRFNFIGNTETTVDGFLAHEVQSVVSEAVTGDHDAVDDSGNPVYQSIDQSKLVPLLTAALQEAIAEIETLKTKVAALEAG